MCPLCKHTFALLPKFIKKFHRYAKDVIAFALEQLRKFKYSKVQNKLDQLLQNLPGEPNIYLSISTLYQWKKKFCFNS
jgi:hypothetical protein